MKKLRPSQLAAVEHVSRETTLLLSDVGSGKTATALTAISRRPKRRTLILGTVRICNMVWPEEAKTWTPELTYASAAGLPPRKRMALLEDTSIDLVGLNYDNLIWACQTYGNRLPELFPQLVIDESSKLESPTAKSQQALAPLLPGFIWCLPMTGTPRANHLHDLWGHAYLTDLGATLGKFREGFLQKWFRPVMRFRRMEWMPKYGASDEIHERLKAITHRMVFDGDKPEVVEIDLKLPLHPVVAAIQQEITIQQRDHDTVTIDNITYARGGERSLGKALQLSSGQVYDDADNVRHLHDAKLDALREIVEEAQGSPMMVIYIFAHERDLLLKEFPQARVLSSDAQMVEEWNRGEIEILLCHPLATGYGLNLQSGSSLQVWYSPTSDAELYTQTVGRLARPGQPSPVVRIIRIIMEGTEDARCYQVVRARQQSEQDSLRLLENDKTQHEAGF